MKTAPYKMILSSTKVLKICFFIHAYPCQFVAEYLLLFLEFTRDLLDFDDDKFGRLERSKADFNVDNTEVSVSLSRRLAVAFDIKRLVRRAALKCSLAEKSHHEGV